MNSEERSLLETSCGVTLSLEQEEQLDRYLATLQEWNQRVNLTAVREASDLLRFHFFEALWAARNFMTPRTHLADIGSG
ncbi:MAG: class I SAM-dependent methyltransferase, partial [Acidobacteriota bacterium]